MSDVLFDEEGNEVIEQNTDSRQLGNQDDADAVSDTSSANADTNVDTNIDTNSHDDDNDDDGDNGYNMCRFGVDQPKP